MYLILNWPAKLPEPGRRSNKPVTVSPSPFVVAINSAVVATAKTSPEEFTGSK